MSEGELKLANQLIDHLAVKKFDPSEFQDEFKGRVAAAIQRKVQGKEVSVAEEATSNRGSNVIDLMQALKASLDRKPADAPLTRDAQAREPCSHPQGPQTMKARTNVPARILADAGVPRQRIATTLRKLVRALSAAPSQKGSVPSPAAVPRRRKTSDARALEHASDHFARGFAAEATDIAAAREGYRAALATYRGHLDASINLGRLQHLNGELAAAEKNLSRRPACQRGLIVQSCAAT